MRSSRSVRRGFASERRVRRSCLHRGTRSLRRWCRHRATRGLRPGDLAGLIAVAAVASALLVACGDATRSSDPGARCGDGVKPCACGDTVVADHRLTADVVCNASNGRCDVDTFACTGLTLASGVTLDGAGFALIGPPVPSASGRTPDARRDALYGVELPSDTFGAEVRNLEVRGFARGVVFRNALRPCDGDADCPQSSCQDVPPELAATVPDPSQRYCAGNVATDVTVVHDARLGTQLGLFGFAVTGPDPAAADDVGGMNVIERGRVAGSGDRGVHLSQARLNVVRGVRIDDAARENVHLLRGSDDNLLAHLVSTRPDGGAPNVFVEDSKRNLFTGSTYDGSFVHVVGASDENRFVDVTLAGGGARYDFETDVEEATGLERAPRGNVVLRGAVLRSGSRTRPCVILDGAAGTTFDTVALQCGDEPLAPGETPVDVRVARDDPDPALPNVFHVADCDPDGPDLHVELAPGVTTTPVVLDDRSCDRPARTSR